MKLSTMIQRMPQDRAIKEFIKKLKAELKDGDCEVSDESLRNIELQVRARIDPHFELLKDA